LVKLGDSISVGDLVLPAGVIAESAEEEMLVRVAAPVAQAEEEEVVEEATSAEPEVIKRGKADEEEGEE
jgi:large subunit ribosomal protein L25